MAQLNPYLAWLWRHGGRREFWAVFEPQVGQFVKDNGLVALSKEAQMGLALGGFAGPMGAGTATMSTEMMSYPIWWFGGMKAAHLHYKGAIYPLQPDQWAKFAAPILEKAKAKLNAARSVSFGKMLDVSEAVNSMV